MFYEMINEQKHTSGTTENTIEFFTGHGGSMLSGLGIKKFYEKIPKQDNIPVEFNVDEESLPNNNIKPAIFYRYSYLEKYYLSVLYNMLQKLEDMNSSDVVEKYASPQIEKSKMTKVTYSREKSDITKQFFDHFMSKIKQEFRYFDVPFVLNTEEIYLSVDDENLYLNSNVYTIRFIIRKNFHYLLAVEKCYAPTELEFYVRFIIKDEIPHIIISRINDIYDQFVVSFLSYNTMNKYYNIYDKNGKENNNRYDLLISNEEIIKLLPKTIRKYYCTTKDGRIFSAINNKIECIIEGGIWS